jgi:hypothetical protein
MAIEAFVLPYVGRSAGVVFWEPTRAAARAARRRGVAAAPERIEVYAPGPLSPGEHAELADAFAASLGEAFIGRGNATVVAWWIAGIVAAVLLAVGVLELGPGFAWIVLAAALTALPWSVPRARATLSRREVVHGRRLARRLGEVEVVPGTDVRQQERIAAIWRAGRRSGPAAKQFADLEAQCREQAWPAVAAFYADRLRELHPSDAWERRRLHIWPRRRRGAPAHALVEMRAW